MANRPQLNWLPVTTGDVEVLAAMCPRDEFRVISCHGQVLSPLPQKLTDKYDHLIIAASGTADGSVFYMFNGARVDGPAKAIDQMPFGFAVVGGEVLPSGVLVQHADHSDRTTEPPPEFWKYIEASGIGHGFPLEVMPARAQGRLHELSPGNSEAFSDLIRHLRGEQKQE